MEESYHGMGCTFQAKKSLGDCAPQERNCRLVKRFHEYILF